MTNYQQARVKLTNTQLKEICSKKIRQKQY